MKIIITEEQLHNLIPPSVKRRMTNKDFEILDGIIDNNKLYFITQSFGEYLDGTLRDSLNEFIREYKVEEIDPNLDNDDWDNEEDIIYNIFWQLIPFLKKKYHDVFYDYYMEYHRRRGNINESKKDLYNLIPSEIKRRLEPGDLDKFDEIVDNKYKLRGYYLSGDFENYFNSVISDSIDTFVVNYKFPRYEGGTDLDDYNDDRRKVLSLFRGLIPFFLKKYRDKLYQFYRDL
jgi:hypothetical protein